MLSRLTIIMAYSKAPKRSHYFSSSSLKHRVECAFARKIAFIYFIEVSPCNVYRKMAVKSNKIKRKRSVFESTKAFEKRILREN